MKDITYYYIDTNSNRYRITADTISYDPIPVHLSSSGRYDGGEAKKVSLEKADFEAISTQMEDILNDTTIHLEKRVKPSSMVRKLSKDGARESAIISWRGEKRSTLESFLKEILARD